GSGKGCAYLSCILTFVPSGTFYNPAVVYNNFYGAGGGAVAVETAIYPQIMVNGFYDNMRECPHTPACGGEALYIQSDSSTGLIYNNTLDGNLNTDPSTGTGSSGLEIEGTNYSIEYNTISNHKHAGITLESVVCANLVSNIVTGNGGDTVLPVNGVV